MSQDSKDDSDTEARRQGLQKKYFKLNKNTTSQNLWDVGKKEHRRKVKALFFKKSMI